MLANVYYALTLFMTVPVKALCLYGVVGWRDGEKKQNRTRKVTRESDLLLADSSTLPGDSR